MNTVARTVKIRSLSGNKSRFRIHSQPIQYASAAADQPTPHDLRNADDALGGGLDQFFDFAADGATDPRVSGGLPFLGHLVPFVRTAVQLLAQARAECGDVAGFDVGPSEWCSSPDPRQ